MRKDLLKGHNQKEGAAFAYLWMPAWFKSTLLSTSRLMIMFNNNFLKHKLLKIKETLPKTAVPQ